MADKQQPRRLRRFLRWTLGLVALMIVLLISAPTLVTWGLGAGLVRGALQKRFNATVSFEQLRVGWFGAQSVQGLVITDDRGVRVAEVNVSIGSGLAALLLGQVETLVVDVEGIARGDLRPDGSTSFEDLIVRRHQGASPQARADARPRVDLPATVLTLHNLRLEMNDLASRRLIVLDSLHGEARYEPGGSIELNVASPTTSGDQTGSLDLAATIDGLFDADGWLTINGASGTVELNLEQVPVPLASQPVVLRTAQVRAFTDNLASHVNFSVTADAMIQDPESGREIETGHLEGTIVAEQLVSASGRLQVGPERLTGSISGRSVPTALIQPFFKNGPILLSRDVGPMVDLDATFSAQTQRRITITASGEHMDLAVDAVINEDRSLRCKRLRVTADLAPELVAAVTGFEIADRTPLVIDLNEFVIPALDDDGRPQLHSASMSGTIFMDGPFDVIDDDRTLVTLEGVRVALGSPRLGDEFHVSGQANVDDAQATFTLQTGGVVGADGSFRPSHDRGRLAVRGLRRATLARLVPDHAELIEQGVEDPLAIEIVSSTRNGAVRVDIRVTGPGMDASVTATREQGALRITKAQGTYRVRPGLVALLQRDASVPVVLDQPVTVGFEAEPIDLTDWMMGEGTDSVTVAASLRSDEIVARQVPGMAKPIGVGDLTADVAIGLGTPRAWSAKGTARLETGDGKTQVASLEYDVRAVASGVPVGRVHASGVSVVDLESLVGSTPGSLSQWLGDRGDATIQIQETPNGIEGTLTAAFGRLEGDFDLTLDDTTLTVTARNPTMLIARELIQKRLTPAGAATPATAQRVVVERDIALALDIKALKIPRKTVAGKQFDLAGAVVNATLTGGPVVVNTAGYGRSSLLKSVLRVRSNDLAEGLTLSFTGEVEVPGHDTRASITMDGTVRRLIHDGALAPSRAVLDLKAIGRRVPTALFDALGSFKGMLTAAIGPELAIDARARGLSGSAGTLEARLESANGWLDLYLQGADGALVIKPDRPFRAELALTPVIGQQLLKKIHPVLADIRSAAPVRVTVTSATVPLDGDPKKLNADIEITVGAVEFDSGAVALAFLTFANSRHGETMPGFIEPIRARIRQGIVTYEKFAVVIHKVRMDWSGQIDLTKGTVDLHTEIPIVYLAMSIKELEGLGDISVPIRVHGRFGAIKYDVDPEFIAEAAIQGGINQLLNDASRDIGLPLNDIFNDIFGSKKKKDRR